MKGLYFFIINFMVIQMRNRLRSSLQEAEPEEGLITRILEYFISRLGATTAFERTCAAHAFALFLQVSIKSANRNCSLECRRLCVYSFNLF